MPNPFTCPSCRASVRETRANASITTLLEMYLQANPSKARSGQEKEETGRAYTPGENVLPKIRRKKEGIQEAADRRMVEEAREMSLRDVGIRGTGSYERGIRHQVRDRAGDSRDEDARQRRVQNWVQDTANNPASPGRQIEHQSSLRSLLSGSDRDSSDIHEQILRQIMDEGILDGIDLNNIDVSQEDELSEKIAEAYRRRHGRRLQPQDNNRSERSRSSNARDQRSSAQEQRQHRRPARSPNTTDQTTHSSHPPVSRPHLLEAYPTGQGHRRRTSSEQRQQTSPNPVSLGAGSSPETQRQAARSATDLSNRPQSSSNHRGRPTDFSDHGRRTTDPEHLRPRGQSRDSTSRTSAASRSPRGQSHEFPLAIASRVPSDTVTTPQSAGSHPSITRLAEPIAMQAPQQNDGLRLAPANVSQSPSSAVAQTILYPEPSISCDRCGKSNLEYEVHQNCSQCNDGEYNLCLRCYRLGRGCLRWYGFGYAAMQRYERQAPPAGYPPNHHIPHCLKGHRYLQPSPETRKVVMQNSKLSTSSDPSRRLQYGSFCSNCSNFAPDCFWKCDICNEGEWGFCNPCVNQGKCCTHALLPVAQASSTDTPTSQLSPTYRVSSTSFTPIANSPQINSQAAYQPSDSPSIPLTFHTKCDICTYLIPPSTTRFHCPQCNGGDYDICTACYNRLVSFGKISSENGNKGWRRCPNRHRMMVVGFEDSSKGQRRVVVRDMVGGHALNDDAMDAEGEVWTWRDEGQQQQAVTVPKSFTNKAVNGNTPLGSNNSPTSPPPVPKMFPPNGGVGMHVVALWSYWPHEGVTDELAFPKGAEIRECKDINGDWFWGVYCARKGLFPGNYGRVVEVVGMS